VINILLTRNALTARFERARCVHDSPCQSHPLPTLQAQAQSSGPGPEPQAFVNFLIGNILEFAVRLNRTQIRRHELSNRRLEAALAGRDDEAKMLTFMLAECCATFEKENLVKILGTLKVAPAQGPPRLTHGPTPAGTTRHSMHELLRE